MPLFFTEKPAVKLKQWIVSISTKYFFQKKEITNFLISSAATVLNTRMAYPCNVPSVNQFLVLNPYMSTLDIYPIGSMYGIFTYICHILPLKTTKCR